MIRFRYPALFLALSLAALAVVGPGRAAPEPAEVPKKDPAPANKAEAFRNEERICMESGRKLRKLHRQLSQKI